MVQRYALVSDGVVANVILWDADAQPDVQFGAEVLAVQLPDGSRVGPGWTYAGGVFGEPPPEGG